MLVRQVTGSLDGMERKRNKQSYVVVGGCGSSWCIRPSNPALGRKLCFETYFLLFKSSRPSFFRHLRHRHLSSISILSTIHDSQSAFVSKWKEENMYFVLFVMRVLDLSSIFPLARFSFSIFILLLVVVSGLLCQTADVRPGSSHYMPMTRVTYYSPSAHERA